ncbi:M23 family metallopeptidase [Streptomyces sp. NPDC012600]|uniref:M23 family metallopeptidase n=1 Tax=unclassified Streptomyces TaxID=2593676 RepID=UPI0036CCA135
MSVRRAVERAHRVSWVVFFALVTAEFFVDLPGPRWTVTLLPAGVVSALLLAVIVLQSRAAAPRGEPGDPVQVEPPVTGRWTALNSPVDKVPSHGTHVYGQTYAIDIVAEPEGEDDGTPARPPFRWVWPVVRRNDRFPAFGAPLLAVADATVVRVSDGQRDHLSRNSLPALAYLMLIEGNVRMALGAHRIFGNHVILDLGGGTYAAYAHVRRGSLKVRAGDRVRAGQEIGQVGNSGNTTEPHLHFQLMDHPDLHTARGIPFTWRGVGVPGGGETFTVGERAASARPDTDVSGAG